MRKQLEWVATPFSVQATSSGFVKDDGDCDNEKSVHGVCFLVVVVVVSYTGIILILSSIVNPYR